jgi:hypothetical protein
MNNMFDEDDDANSLLLSPSALSLMGFSINVSKLLSFSIVCLSGADVVGVFVVEVDIIFFVVFVAVRGGGCPPL